MIKTVSRTHSKALAMKRWGESQQSLRLLRPLQEVPIGETEHAAFEDGIEAYDNLRSKLACVPTSIGPTPHQIGAQLL